MTHSLSPALSHSLPNLPRVMPSVHPVELSPLLSRQRPKNRVVQDLRPGSEPALAIVQAQLHRLQFGSDRPPHLFDRHTSRLHAFRSLASTRHIPEVHYQQSRQTILQSSPRTERRALFQASFQAEVRALVGKQQMLQYLRRTPLPSGSRRQLSLTRAPYCFFEFLLQSGSVLI